MSATSDAVLGPSSEGLPVVSTLKSGIPTSQFRTEDARVWSLLSCCKQETAKLRTVAAVALEKRGHDRLNLAAVNGSQRRSCDLEVADGYKSSY